MTDQVDEPTLDALRALSALLKLREEARVLPTTTLCSDTYTRQANQIWEWAETALAHAMKASPK
jgi:hypothetical protein